LVRFVVVCKGHATALLVSLTLKKGKTATAPDGDADLSEVWQVRADEADMAGMLNL
jgi:hypothetical protein